VVFVTQGTHKGTARSAQEYRDSLLVLIGKEYVTIPFADLHPRLCDVLRGDKPRVMAQYLEPGGGVRIVFEDGTIKRDDANE
jgi:hypothetical protein